jgi:predicted nucleic acid-binding protein
MPLLLDTGVLYALADKDDEWHERCVDYVQSSRELLLVPVTVIPEAAYLVGARLGSSAERQLIRSISEREVTLESLTDVDVDRCTDLMGKYTDIGFVDASVVAIAERLRLTAIATTDRRHFSGIRPRHRASFTLVP